MANIPIAADIVKMGNTPRQAGWLYVYALSEFYLADRSPVQESSPYNNGVPYMRIPLTPSGENPTEYISPEFILPSTEDALINAGGAKWGIFIFDNADSPRLICPLARLESFRMPSTFPLETFVDIVGYNQTHPLPPVTPGSAYVDENLTVGGYVAATYFEGDGSHLTGITGATGGVSNTGTTNIAADTDVDGVGVINFSTRNVLRLQITNAGALDTLGGFPSSALGSLPAVGHPDRLYRLTDGNKGLVRDTGVSWSPLNGGIYNIDDFGAKANDSSFDSWAAIQAAIEAAEAIATATGRTKSVQVYVPIGTYYISKPLRFKVDGTIFTGAGKSLSIIRAMSGFGAGWMMVVGPGTNANPVLSYDDVPTTTALASGTGAAYSMADGGDVYFNLRDSAAWDINGRTAMSLEFIFKPLTLGAYCSILSGAGNEDPNDAGNNYTLMIGTTDADALTAKIQLGDNLYTLNSANGALVVGTAYVVQFNFSPNADPTKANIKLFLNGALVDSETTATGDFSATQAIHEDMILGPYFKQWPESTLITSALHCTVDSIRLSSVARNTSAYTSSLTKFASDGSTLWLTNWLIDGMHMKATSAYGTEYLPLRRATFPFLTNYVEISRLRLEPSGGAGHVGGISAYLSTRGNYRDLYIDYCRLGIRMWNNCFLSNVRDCEIYGDTNSRGNIFNLSASGVNSFENLQLLGPSYNIVGVNGSGQISHCFMHGAVRWNMVLGNSDTTTSGGWNIIDSSATDEDATPEGVYQGPALLFNHRSFQMIGGSLESVVYENKYPRISGGDKYTFIGTSFNTHEDNDRQIDFDASHLPTSPVMLVNCKNCGSTYPPVTCTEIPWTTTARAANVAIVTGGSTDTETTSSVFQPVVDDAMNLGGSSHRWKDGYIKNLHSKTVEITGTDGTQFLYIHDGYGTLAFQYGTLALPKIYALGGTSVFSAIGVNNSAAATTPGSVVKKIQVFDANGASIGYLAVYNSIS